MNIRSLPAISLFACAAVACTTEPTLPDASEQWVIEAFLYAGEPVDGIRITEALPLGSSDTAGVPIDDAVVTLVRSGVRFSLTLAANGTGRYHYAGNDLEVAPGDVFTLEARRNGVVASGTTVVPSPPESVSLSADSLVIAAFGGGRGGGGRGGTGSQLIARWPNTSRELFYVVVESVDSSAAPITAGFRPDRRFIFAPIAADSFAVSTLSLSYYGLHQVRVYHVNAEYAALYESRQQDTRDLNEPATNLTNALGVFSAFSSRTAAFRAVAAQ